MWLWGLEILLPFFWPLAYATACKSVDTANSWWFFWCLSESCSPRSCRSCSSLLLLSCEMSDLSIRVRCTRLPFQPRCWWTGCWQNLICAVVGAAVVKEGRLKSRSCPPATYTSMSQYTGRSFVSLWCPGIHCRGCMTAAKKNRESVSCAHISPYCVGRAPAAGSPLKVF